MKDSLIKQCLDILKTDDVRNEIKFLFSPVTDLILYEIYPYIYVIILLVFLIFILTSELLILEKINVYLTSYILILFLLYLQAKKFKLKINYYLLFYLNYLKKYF